MGSLLVVTGPPGSGKSTVAAVLAQREGPSVLVGGDAFFAFLARDAIEPWLPASHRQNTVVTTAAAKATGAFVDGGFRTIYDGIVGPWFLETFASATGLDFLDYVILLTDVETCVERVATRAGHGFRDADATRKMHDEFSRAEVDRRHVLEVGPDTVTQVVERIERAVESGGLRCAITDGA